MAQSEAAGWRRVPLLARPAVLYKFAQESLLGKPAVAPKSPRDYFFHALLNGELNRGARIRSARRENAGGEVPVPLSGLPQLPFDQLSRRKA